MADSMACQQRQQLLLQLPFSFAAPRILSPKLKAKHGPLTSLQLLYLELRQLRVSHTIPADL